MRSALLLLVFALPGFASEEAILHAFRIAREDPYSPRGRARMDRAIEGLSKRGGVLSVAALGGFLRAADKAETKVRKDRIEVERRGRVAHTGLKQVKRELEHLRHRENAGATGLGPQVTAREDKLRTMERTLAAAKGETARSIRLQEEIFRKREASIVACARILARIKKPDEIATAISSLRKTLDVDKPEQVILLVRILRESGRKEAAGALLEVFSHPKTGVAGRTAAACAVAHLGEASTTRQLIERLRKDNSLKKTRILHELGLTARQRLADLDAAEKWAATLK